jgi:hypothetical protein
MASVSSFIFKGEGSLTVEQGLGRMGPIHDGYRAVCSNKYALSSISSDLPDSICY